MSKLRVKTKWAVSETQYRTTMSCSVRVEMHKTGDDVEQTTLYSDDSLPATKGLNAAVQCRHQHMRISCNGSFDSITSVSLSAVQGGPKK